MSDIQAIRERIWLIPDGERGFMWCDDPAPGIGMEPEDATEYVLAERLSAAEARAEAAEARVGYLQIIIDCVVENCEASASSYQERIETIHRVTSALALEWAEHSTLKGTPDDR